MFQELIEWSKSEFSYLPWRKKRTLYKTLVSEIMLQQTTVQTVLNHFDRFIEQYPTIEELASASEEQVCISWKGLGYYRRARNLRKAAIDIVENHNGKIPRKKDALLEINGIGEYTASALISIGMNKETLAIDANLERVLSRIFYIKEEKGKKLHAKINELFKSQKLKIESKTSFRDLNEALMDLGRLYCKANKVSCDICPLRNECKGRAKEPLELPFKPLKKDKKYYELKLLKIIVKRGKKVLANQRNEQQWLSGQIELPTFIIESEDKKLNQYPSLKDNIELGSIKPIKTSITKYKIRNYIVEMNNSEFKKLKSVKNSSFKYYDSEKANFTTTSIKSLKQITS